MQLQLQYGTSAITRHDKECRHMCKPLFFLSFFVVLFVVFGFAFFCVSIDTWCSYLLAETRKKHRHVWKPWLFLCRARARGGDGWILDDCFGLFWCLSLLFHIACFCSTGICFVIRTIVDYQLKTWNIFLKGDIRLPTTLMVFHVVLWRCCCLLLWYFVVFCYLLLYLVVAFCCCCC